MEIKSKKMKSMWDLPSGPVIKASRFHCGGVDFIIVGRTKILHA